MPARLLSSKSTDRLILAALLLAAPLLYLPNLTFNLPVASGIDERNALEVLRRFQHGSLNPQFFQYPTLYFYLVYACVLPFRYTNANAMIAGRLLDFVLVGVVACLAYIFCRDRLHSRAAGVIAAGLVLASPILSGIAGFLHPDVLMTVAGSAALYYLVDYFETRKLRSWIFGLTLIGVSVGCKYTAFVLYLAYAATEILSSLRDRRMLPAERGMGKRFSRSVCVGVLVTLGVALLLGAYLLPVDRLLAWVLRSHAQFEIGAGKYYVQVFAHIRRSIVELGLLVSVLAVLCHFSRHMYESISIKRLYYGLAIILLVSILCTPYCVVHPANFIFELGALARSNIVVVGGEPQWRHYAGWLFFMEGIVPVGLGLAGIALLAMRSSRRFHIVVIYLALYGYVLGSSQRGYPHYLAPIVPLIFCGSGLALARLWQRDTPLAATSSLWRPYRSLAVILLAVVSVQGIFKISAARRQARSTNSFFASYNAAKSATTGTAYYAGYAPAIELEEAGIKTQALSWATLSGGPLGRNLACGDTLILNTPQAVLNHIDAGSDDSVAMLVDAPGPGQSAQQVVAPRGCH